MMPSPSGSPEPFGPETPWHGEARALLESAISRHGGWDAWRALGTLSLRFVHLDGVIPLLKGEGGTFPAPGRVDATPHEHRAVFYDYPAPGTRGLYSNGKVALIGAGDAVVDTHPDRRATFRGFGKWRRWSPLDALYFFGYAITHYLSLPFTLADATPLGRRDITQDGRRLTGIAVALPVELHTHSARQTFYFDDGLLMRHDYVADIISPLARGAHHSRDYVRAQGIAVARERHVVARVGRWRMPLVALHADLEVMSG